MMKRAWIAIAVLASLCASSAHSQVLPAWTFTHAAQDSLAALWSRSLQHRREEVACLGGMLLTDTVRVELALPLPYAQSDSLTADAERSLATCGPPQWIGTAHTHVRSTDDPSPAPRFSPADRVVMSLWSGRWGRAGGFCVLYSERAAHCEVYPPAPAPR